MKITLKECIYLYLFNGYLCLSVCLYLCSSVSLNVLLTAVGLILFHMGYHPEMARLSHPGDGGECLLLRVVSY